jgi:hypothetical protein
MILRSKSRSLPATYILVAENLYKIFTGRICNQGTDATKAMPGTHGLITAGARTVAGLLILERVTAINCV